MRKNFSENQCIINLYCLAGQGGGGFQPLQQMSSDIHQKKHKKKSCARLWELTDLHPIYQLHVQSQEPSLIPPRISKAGSIAEHPADCTFELGCLPPLEVNNMIWTLIPAGSVPICLLFNPYSITALLLRQASTQTLPTPQRV